MRRGIRLLAICGLVILGTDGLSAQDFTGARQPQTGVQSRNTFFPRGGAQPAAEVAVEATDSAEATAIASTEPPSADEQWYNDLFGPRESAAEVTISSEAAPEPIPVQEASFATQVPTTNAGVVNAEYTQQFGQPQSSGVRQVTAEVPAATPVITPGTAPNVPRGPIGEQNPAVTLKWVKNGAVNVGQEAHCDLKVKNTSSTVVANIVVQAYFPNTVRLTNADPQPEASQEYLSWTFDSLKPQEEKTIHVTLIPSQRGPLPTFASVRFTGASSEVFNVEEPLLKVALSGPAEVRVGDPASQMITVTNPGTGLAENVKIEAVLPAGLEHPRGERLSMEIGSLNPGESRKLRLGLAAIDGGKQTVQVVATADGDLRQIATSDVTVIAPSLNIAVAGPGLRYKGRTADYTLTVSNVGAATSNNVRVLHRLPEGFSFVKADKGGKYDEKSGVVSWFVGHLATNANTELKLTLKADAIGSFTHSVAAVSEHGAQNVATTVTRVEGSASLVLEIVDLDDPVEIGAQTAYEIRVKNEGTAAAKSVSVSCELPNAVKLLSAKGPTQSLAENGLLIFRSLESLEPGKTAIYRVHVEGTTDGNHRFRARLASESIQEPLIFEELTRFYRD